jgi:hypothetical protein
VRVACTVGLSDLTGLRLAGSRRIEGSATAVVDRYRGTAAGLAGDSR